MCDVLGNIAKSIDMISMKKQVDQTNITTYRVLIRILKIGVKLQSTGKVWSLTILFFWDFLKKVGIRIKKLE